MGSNIRVCQTVQLQAVEPDGALAQWHLGEVGPPLGVELIAIDPDIARRVLVSDDPGLQG
jgi:hypothetical protein